MNDLRVRAIALLCIASPFVVIVTLAIDARARRGTSRTTDAALAIVAPRLPTSDLALSGGARWLRAPSLEEPGAAFADGPALPDPDPAGGAMAPPIEIWKTAAERSESNAKRSGDPR